MPPDIQFPNRVRAAFAVAALASLGGCAALGPTGQATGAPAAPPAPDVAAIPAATLADTTLALHRFAAAAPDEQAALLAAARDAAAQVPSPAARLRYALLLGVPAQPGADPALARQLLQALLSEPDRLAPTEHAVAFIELRRLDRELALLADANTLRERAEQVDAEALDGLNRRLLAETDENQRLRRALEDAQAKLAAIALIERQPRDRESAPPEPPEPP